jgi:hypothetical protein
MSCRSIRQFVSLRPMQRSKPAPSQYVGTQHPVCARSHESMYQSMAAAVGGRLSWSTIQELRGAGHFGKSTSNCTQGISSWWYEHGILQDRRSQNHPMTRGISKAISALPGIGSRSASVKELLPRNGRVTLRRSVSIRRRTGRGAVIGRRRFVNGCQIHRSSSSDSMEGVAQGQDLRDLDQGPVVFRSDRLYNQARLVIPPLSGERLKTPRPAKVAGYLCFLARDDGIPRPNVRPAHFCLVYLPNSLTRFVFSTSCHL